MCKGPARQFNKFSDLAAMMDGNAAESTNDPGSKGQADDGLPAEEQPPNPQEPKRRQHVSHGEGEWLVKHHQHRRESKGRQLSKLLESMEMNVSDRFLKRSSRNISSSHHRGDNVSTVISNSPSNDDNSPTLRASLTKLSGEDIPDRPQSDAKEIVGVNSILSEEGQTRSVAFTTCTVRYYETVLGDNPFCSSGGPPLSIGWAFDPSTTDADIPVDTYEDRNPHRKTEWDLLLSRAERERRLLDWGYSRDSIANVIRESNRIKAKRRQTVLNLRVAGAEEFAERIGRTSKKLLLRRKSSSHLYNEWKERPRVMVQKQSNHGMQLQEQSRKTSGTYYPPSSAGRVPGPSSTTATSEQTFQKCSGSHKGSTPLTGTVRSVSNSSCQANNVDDDHVVKQKVSKGHKKENSNAPPTDSMTGTVPGNAFGISRTSLSAWANLSFNESKFDETFDEGEQIPFAEVDLIYPKSPAEEAGLQKGDKLLKFGNVTHNNHRNLKAIAELGIVASAKEKSISLVILRNGDALYRSIRPSSWDEGPGCFGFLLRGC